MAGLDEIKVWRLRDGMSGAWTLLEVVRIAVGALTNTAYG